MVNVLEMKQRSAQLKTEVGDKLVLVEKGELGLGEFNEFMKKAETENNQIAEGIKSYNAAISWRSGTDPAPDGKPPAANPTARDLAMKANWDTYQQLVQKARNNLNSKGSGKGEFTFDIDLVRGSQADLVTKAQGVTGLQGVQTSGTTVPPTGNLAQGVYFPGGSAGPTVEPEFIPGIAEMRWYPNVVAELFASYPVSSPLVSYVKQTAMTNNAAAVPEGATKPTSAISVQRFTEQVGKIANLERVTDEQIQDAPYFWSLVQQDGVMGVTRAEEVELIAGIGMPGINGILNRGISGSNLSYPTGFTAPQTVSPINVTIGGAVGAGVATTKTISNVVPGRQLTDPTGVGTAEGFLAALTDIRLLHFFEPDAGIFNPLDWTTVRLAKDANGQYLGGSFFGTNYGQAQNAGPTGIEENLTLWGKRVITTPVMPAGLVLAGDFRDAGKVLRRGGLRVDITNTNGFDFEQNLWTMRIEERVGFQCVRPELLELVALAGGS